MDTLAGRWAALERHMKAYGPEGADPRPAVILFHGCGGLRSHLDGYAEAAAALGVRAFIIDSYAARGWSRAFALSFVCSGLVLRGSERAGDVLAALDGVSNRPDVDASQVVLAGWSHGGWAIMDLMTMPLTSRGEAGISDAPAADLSGIKGLALIYPFVGPGALSRNRPWRRFPPSWAVIARTDHLTTVNNAERVYGALKGAGGVIDTWIAEGTHAFDETTGMGPMRHDPELTQAAIGRFSDFLQIRLDL